MNSWCESCAKKSQCYTAEIRPKCYVATTNTDTHDEALKAIATLIKARAEQTERGEQMDIGKDLQDAYTQGFEDGYKAKESDRANDCDGCKFVGVSARCEGCCRNYADGYVAEQTEPTVSREEIISNARLVGYQDGVKACNKEWLVRLGYKSQYGEPQTEREGE